jgi:fructosamine-3-kinase
MDPPPTASIATLCIEDSWLASVAAHRSFVRHNAQNETVLRLIAAEQEELAQLRRLSTRFSTVLEVEGDEVVVWP